MSTRERIKKKIAEGFRDVSTLIYEMNPEGYYLREGNAEYLARKIVDTLGPLVRVLEEMLALVEKEDAAGDEREDVNAKILATLQRIEAHLKEGRT